jgi:hypothetical protein
MTTSQTLNEIQATPKQYFALSRVYAYRLMEANSIPKIKFGIIRSRTAGVLHSQFPMMTRGKAQELFDATKIPAFFTRLVKIDDMVGAKAPAKVKAVKTAKRTATKVAKPKATTKVAAKAAPTSDLEKRMAFVEGEVSRMSEDVLVIKSGLETLIERLG